MIEIKSLSKRFDDVTAIDDLSLSFEGKVLGVCGAKNSGKTVLLNIICGIVPPSEGEVLVFGENLFLDNAAAKKTVGCLLEDSPMPEEMTPNEFLKFVGQAKGIPAAKLEKQIEAALDITALYDLKDIYIRHLSIGQRKILGVAQALLGNPKLIVLDDPFTALNKREKAIMKSIISTLGEIKTVVVSARKASTIEDLCSEVITLSTTLVKDEEPDDEAAEKEDE